MAKKSTPPLSAAGANVRQYDSDRFLASLFAPAAQRPLMWELLSLNVEIARIPGLVSEPLLGEIRLQWWQETLEGLAKDTALPPPGPLAFMAALSPEARAPIIEALLKLVEARRRELDPTPFASVAEVEAYAEATSAPLLEVLGAPNTSVATGYALVGLSRAAPVQLAGLSRAALLQRAEALLAAAGEVTGQAHAWHVLATLYLRQIKKIGIDRPQDVRLRHPHPWRGLALLWASWRK